MVRLALRQRLAGALRVARASTVTLDQIASSAVTFALQVAAAPVSSAADYGKFSIVSVVQVSQWYLARAAASEPLLVSRGTPRPNPQGGLDRRGSAATATTVGLVFAIGCLVAGTLTSGTLRELLYLQAAASVTTSIVDHGRFDAYATGRPARALQLNLTWLAVFAVAALAASATGTLATPTVLAAWVAASLAPVGLVLWRGVAPFRLRRAQGWVRSQAHVIPGFMTDAVFLAVGTSATFAAITVTAGIDELGTLRKALIPVTVAIVTLLGVSTSLLVHASEWDTRRALRNTGLISAMAVVLPGLIAALLLVVPEPVMTAVLGQPWTEIRPVALVLSVYAALLGITQNALAMIKAWRKPWIGPRVRALQLLAEVTLVVLLASRWGAVGAAAGMATAWAIAAVTAWRVLYVVSREI